MTLSNKCQNENQGPRCNVINESFQYIDNTVHIVEGNEFIAYQAEVY